MIKHNTFKVFLNMYSTLLLSFLVLNISINFTSKLKSVEINKVETILELLVLSVTDSGHETNEFTENTQPLTEEIHHEITWFCNESILYLFPHIKTKHTVMEKANIPEKIFQEILLPPPLF